MAEDSWRSRKFFGRPWQDLIFAIGEVVFLATLAPLLFKHTNIGLFTGLGTAFMLYTFMAAHVSYRNWLTVGLTCITATLWVLIGAGVSFANPVHKELTASDLSINTEIAAHRVAGFFNDHDSNPYGCKHQSKQRGTCFVKLTGDDPMVLKAYVVKYDGQHYSTHLHTVR